MSQSDKNRIAEILEGVYLRGKAQERSEVNGYNIRDGGPELVKAQATSAIEDLVREARIDELKTFFIGLDVWEDTDVKDGSVEVNLDVPEKKIKDRIAQLKALSDQHSSKEEVE